MSERGTVWNTGAEGAWHSVVVHERSTILEAKDGRYEPQK